MKPARTGTLNFAWQAVLIVLPVAVLAVLGFVFLQQDRLLARQEAAERASAVARSLAPELWQRFASRPPSGDSSGARFETDGSGGLLAPAPYDLVPRPGPDADPAQLNAAQAQLWTDGRRHLDTGSWEAATTTVRQFVSSTPPADLAAQLCYELGLRLVESGHNAGAEEMFRAVIERFPSALGETGLPLLPLAKLKMFRLQKTLPDAPAEEEAVTLESVCKALIDLPSPITPLVLSELAKGASAPAEQAVARRSLARWQEQETARRLHSAARSYLLRQPKLTVAQSNLVFWIEIPSDKPGPRSNVNWVAIHEPGTDGTNRVVCRPESELGRIVTELSARPGLPDYLAVSVELAGKRIQLGAPGLDVWKQQNYMTRGGGGLRKAYAEGERAEVLASAGSTGRGFDPLKVSVCLTSPATLLKRQETRGFWFKLLIAASVASALTGLAAAYLAFDRQLRLNAAKSNFVSSVSHELRAPIASVRLMSESLECGRIPDPQRQKEYYRLMHQECRRLSSLVDNVLDLSRIEQGRKQYEVEPTDLPALVRETVELMRPRAAERAVALETSLSGVQDEPVCAPVLDGKAIQQALVNLLDNAIKHSGEGQMVTVGLEPARPAQDRIDGGAGVAQRVLLWVEDQGEGIPPEDHERIFEQFYRRGSELTRQTQGIGIGLSIVKHIVEAHKGRVLVRSAVGQGSRFTIELPITSAVAQ